MPSTKLLKRHHREHPIVESFGLRAHARLVAKLYPASAEGQAALAWLRRKCSACVATIVREIAERDAQMKRVRDLYFPADEVRGG